MSLGLVISPWLLEDGQGSSVEARVAREALSPCDSPGCVSPITKITLPLHVSSHSFLIFSTHEIVFLVIRVGYVF